jgi:SAM-dependent methyltransferase
MVASKDPMAREYVYRRWVVNRARRLVLPRMRRLRRQTVDRPRVRRVLHPVRWGNLRRLHPYAPRPGDRGTAIARWYHLQFLEKHRADVRGRVLEIGDPRYTARFGHEVRSVDILDIRTDNERATLVGDLSDPGWIPEAAFDCVLAPGTLQYVRDPIVGLASLWNAVAPGGNLLVGFPGIHRGDEHRVTPSERWRFQRPGIETWLELAKVDGEIEIVGYGNVLACVAALMHISAEEMDPAELAHQDPNFVLEYWVRAHRPSTTDEVT